MFTKKSDGGRINSLFYSRKYGSTKFGISDMKGVVQTWKTFYCNSARHQNLSQHYTKQAKKRRAKERNQWYGRGVMVIGHFVVGRKCPNTIHDIRQYKGWCKIEAYNPPSPIAGKDSVQLVSNKEDTKITKSSFALCKHLKVNISENRIYWQKLRSS